MHNIPFYRQEKEWTCGAACVRMVCASLGVKKSEREFARLLRVQRKKGTLHKEIPMLLEKYHFQYVVGRKGVIADLRRLLKQRYRCMVGYWLIEHKCPHYAVVQKIGSTKVYLLDPWCGPHHSYSLKEFKKIWYDGEGEEGWFVGIKK